MSDWLHDLDRYTEQRAELQAAVEFTAAKTGFLPELIEKDFWCSVVLGRLYAAAGCPLVFKGGTLLSKAYVDFHRLSEDLDFTLPTPPEMTRGHRSKRGKAIAALVLDAMAGLLTPDADGWRSFNASTQHQIKLGYPSVFGGTGTIKVEVGQREMPMQSTPAVELGTLLRDPLFDEDAVHPIRATCLSLAEAYAEKVRAALTREDPAPRDLFDLDYAVQSGALDWEDEAFLLLAATKVATEKPSDWLAEERLDAFRLALETGLRPVLRPDAFAAFDFHRSVATLGSIATALRERWPSN